MIARNATRRDTKRKEGASAAKTVWRDKLAAWLRHHRLSAADSLARLLDRPLASVLTWMVIGIALALPVGLNLVLGNVDQLRSSWQSPSQISLFLEPDVDDAQAAHMVAALEARADIDSVEFIPQAQALEEFRQMSGFDDVLVNLDDNPLPNLLLVSPYDGAPDAEVAHLRTALVREEGVAEAVLDMAWLQRLNQLLTLGQRAVLTVGSLLVLGVLLILGNTIRLAIESRRDEIVIVKLVGGSNGFVRRPFLYTGLWYGVGGGFMAALIVALALWFIGEPVARLAQLYSSPFRLQGLGVIGSMTLVLLGGVLGLLGSWLAVGRHLSSIEPR